MEGNTFILFSYSVVRKEINIVITRNGLHIEWRPCSPSSTFCLMNTFWDSASRYQKKCNGRFGCRFSENFGCICNRYASKSKNAMRMHPVILMNQVRLLLNSHRPSDRLSIKLSTISEGFLFALFYPLSSAIDKSWSLLYLLYFVFNKSTYMIIRWIALITGNCFHCIYTFLRLEPNDGSQTTLTYSFELVDNCNFFSVTERKLLRSSIEVLISYYN